MTAPAVLPLQVAVAAALEAAGLRVYNEGEVPTNASVPYHVLGTWSEPAEGERYLTQRSRGQTCQIKSWAEDKVEAMRAHGRIAAVLDDADMVLTGHVLLRCRYGYVTDYKDPTAPPPDLAKHVVIGQLVTRTVAL